MAPAGGRASLTPSLPQSPTLAPTTSTTPSAMLSSTPSATPAQGRGGDSAAARWATRHGACSTALPQNSPLHLWGVGEWPGGGTRCSWAQCPSCGTVVPHDLSFGTLPSDQPVAWRGRAFGGAGSGPFSRLPPGVAAVARMGPGGRPIRSRWCRAAPPGWSPAAAWSLLSPQRWMARMPTWHLSFGCTRGSGGRLCLGERQLQSIPVRRVRAQCQSSWIVPAAGPSQALTSVSQKGTPPPPGGADGVHPAACRLGPNWTRGHPSVVPLTVPRPSAGQPPVPNRRELARGRPPYCPGPSDPARPALCHLEPMSMQYT